MEYKAQYFVLGIIINLNIYIWALLGYFNKVAIQKKNIILSNLIKFLDKFFSFFFVIIRFDYNLTDLDLNPMMVFK